jgi:hypothetical protein
MLAGKPLSAHRPRRFTHLFVIQQKHLKNDCSLRFRQATKTAWKFSPRVDFFLVPGLFRVIAQTPWHHILSGAVSTNVVAFKRTCSTACLSAYATGGRP